MQTKQFVIEHYEGKIKNIDWSINEMKGRIETMEHNKKAYQKKIDELSLLPSELDKAFNDIYCMLNEHFDKNLKGGG